MSTKAISLSLIVLNPQGKPFFVIDVMRAAQGVFPGTMPFSQIPAGKNDALAVPSPSDKERPA